MGEFGKWGEIALVGYVGVGSILLISGPMARLRKVEVQSLWAQNPHTPAWKFRVFSLAVAIGIVLLWPVFYFAAKKHETTLGPTADLNIAVGLACHELLGAVFDRGAVLFVAEKLAYGPMRYSTQELATATALNLYRQASYDKLVRLREVQFAARLTVFDWTKEGKVRLLFASTFEDALYKLFSPLVGSVKE